MAAPGGHPPLPEGWHANWSDQYYQWFYIHSASNTSQWDHPGYAAQPATPQPPPAYSPYGSAAPQTGGQTAGQGERGVMDKVNNLDPRAQTALAVGGGVVAGALLEHKFEEFEHHHHHHNKHGLEGLLGAAGGGALGAKMSGLSGLSGLLGGKQSAGQGYGPTHNYTPHAMGGNWGGHQKPNGHRPGAAPGAAAGWGPAAYKPRHSGPPLFIHAAAFADADVTDRVRRLVTHEQTISIECAKFKEEFGDPWPESNVKMFNILYQYGDRPYEVWAGTTSSGTVAITHDPLSNARMAFLNKGPGRIISLIWGTANALSNDRIDKLEREGELDCKESDLPDGGYWQAKNLICYYRTQQGGFAIAHARQDQTLRLPWNPLAKWS